MCHHVQSHFDLGLANGVLGVLGDVRAEGAKCQGMQEDGYGLRLAALCQGARHLAEGLLTLLHVRGVHIEEDRLTPQAADLVNNPFHVSQGGLAIHMHTEDVEAVLGERAAGRLAKSAGRAENQPPPVKCSTLCAQFRPPPGRREPPHPDAPRHSTWRDSIHATGMARDPASTAFDVQAEPDCLLEPHDRGKLSVPWLDFSTGER